MGHIQVHMHANTLAHPGKCHDCGYNGQDRKFYVDTGIPTEWDGQIIICSACLINIMVKTFGFDPFVELERYKNEAVILLKQTEEDRELLWQLKQGLAKLRVPYSSVAKLAAFVEEESNGTGRSEQSVSPNSGAVNDDSTQPELLEERTEPEPGIISVDPDNSDTGSSNRKSNKPVKSSLGFS